MRHKYRGYGLFCEYTERNCDIGKMCSYIATTDGIYRRDKKRIANQFNYLFKKRELKKSVSNSYLILCILQQGQMIADHQKLPSEDT